MSLLANLFGGALIAALAVGCLGVVRRLERFDARLEAVETTVKTLGQQDGAQQTADSTLGAVVAQHGERLVAIETRCGTLKEASVKTPADSRGVVANPCPLKGPTP